MSLIFGKGMSLHTYAYRDAYPLDILKLSNVSFSLKRCYTDNVRHAKNKALQIAYILLITFRGETPCLHHDCLPHLNALNAAYLTF